MAVMKKSLFAAAIISTAALLFTSCKDKVMGYSVTLWNLPEQKIAAGEVVPVYIKSNISHVYVAGLSDDAKFEVPLWQMTDPEKKAAATKTAAKYQEYAHTYASAKIDGLPIRAQTVNTAKQVYRLRKGEVLKVLYKGTGQAVMAGKKALEGDWLRVLTDDGTQGWCFSYNLALFETDASGNRVGGEEIQVEEETDAYMETVVSTTWYPDYFKTLIDANNIDISRLNASYRFTIDEENKKVILNTNKIHEQWDYDGWTKRDDKEYVLKGIPVIIYYKNAGFIVLRYTGESGKPQDLNFVAINGNIADIVSAERDRRNQAFEEVYTHGNVYKSSSWGQISLTEDGAFRWTGTKPLLNQGIISATAKSGGTVSAKYVVAKKLKENYDGVLTFLFDGTTNEVNFLYKLEEGAMRLEDASNATFDGNMVKSRGAGALILYFTVQ